MKPASNETFCGAARRPSDLLARLTPAHAPFDGGRLAVAVSGGGDSITLLHALIRSGRPPAQLVVLHVDHARRAESPEDAEFVRAAAATVGCEFRGLRLDLPAAANADALREARRSALQNLAEDCSAVALAHHADDQRETRWLALARGAGLRGLSGMRGWHQPWWRPWLSVPRAEIRAWAASVGLLWREDRSNVDFRHPRARVRHLLVPAIARSLGAAETLRVQVLQDEDDWLEQSAQAAATEALRGPSLDRSAFRALSAALQRRVLRIWIGRGAGVERYEALRLALLRPPASRVLTVQIDVGRAVMIGRHGAARWSGAWPPADRGRWGGWGAVSGGEEPLRVLPWAALSAEERTAARVLPWVRTASGERRLLWPVACLADGRTAAPVDLRADGPLIDRHGKAVGLHWVADRD